MIPSTPPAAPPAPVHADPRQRRARRWQIGLAGLGGVMLLVALSSMVAGTRVGEAPGGTATSEGGGSVAGVGDPLTDLGVLPSAAPDGGADANAAGSSNVPAPVAGQSARGGPVANDARVADSAVVGARTDPIVRDLEDPAAPPVR